MVPIPGGETALPGSCPRCGSLLAARGRSNPEWVLALCITGMVLYLPAMILPLLSIGIMGMHASANLLEGVGALFREGYWLLGAIFFLTAVLAPLLKLLLLGRVTLALQLGRGSGRGAAKALRYYGHVEEWGMLEVYMIGILVSIIKLMDMADIYYGAGLAAFVLLLVCSLLSSALFDSRQAWERIERDLP